MKVKKLIKMLQNCNPEAIVVMASDSEGNGYSPLSGFSDQYNYKANRSWEGEIGFNELTEELKESGYSEEDVMKDGQPAIVFWPTN